MYFPPNGFCLLVGWDSRLARAPGLREEARAAAGLGYRGRVEAINNFFAAESGSAPRSLARTTGPRAESPSARRSPGRWDSGHSGCSKVALLGTFLESWVQTPDGHVGVTNIQVPCPVGVCTVTWVLSSNPGSATQLP